MPITPIRGLGTQGVNRDTSAVLQPPESFTDALNVRFDDGSVGKYNMGHVQVFPDLTGAPNPHFGIHWPRPGTRFNIYANETDVYRVDQAGNMSEISTGSTYSSGARWHGSLFTGGYAVILNNTVDTPQYILYGTTGASTETTLTNLPGWEYLTGVTTRARVLRPYRNLLMAANLSQTENSVVTELPSSVRISNEAAAGSIPSSWEPDQTAGSTAGTLTISQTSPIIEMRELRGQMMVYTEDSIHSISFGGGTAPTVRDLSTGWGCLAIDCVAEFDGQHFIVDRNDIYTHSGSGGIRSVVDSKMRKYFFSELNQAHAENTFVSVNRKEDEIWVCFPNQSANAQGDCNEALIWNYRENHWTRRELPNIRAGFQSPFVRNNTFETADERLYTLSRADSRMYAMDEGNTFNGTPFTAYIERKRLDPGLDEQTVWMGSMYLLFDAERTSSSSIQVYARGQNNFGEDINLTTDRNVYNEDFNPQSNTRGYKVDTRREGRLINYRIESTDDQSWLLSGISIKSGPYSGR